MSACPLRNLWGPLSKAALLAFGGWLWLAAAAGAQDLAIPEVSYPDLPERAAMPEGFVPPGWRLETKAEGDLNGDGHADLALVLRQNDPTNVIPHEGLGENPLDTNPRILAVALHEPPGGYRVAIENHVLIPRRTDPVMADPLEDGGIAVQRGALRVTLHLFMSAGGWGMGNTTFVLRLRDRTLELIGYDRSSVTRNTGAIEETSINYLTGRVKFTRGNIGRDETEVAWRKLPRRPLLTIDAVGDGLEFDPGH